MTLPALHRVARELPLGAIRPEGWIRAQLRLQADGITGALPSIWEDVGPDSGWLGGGGDDWERGPYYLDGLIPLAWVLDDAPLKERATAWIEWILASQREDGFFGPATNDDWWPRMIAVKAVQQYADAEDDDRILPFLARWFAYQLRELPRRPLASWGRARGAENVLGAWWLYERTHDEELVPLMRLLIAQTADWNRYLATDLITGPAREFSHFTHGPNVAMGVKTGAAASLLEPDDRARARRDETELAFDRLDRWHGQAHGTFSGDEWLGGRSATAGLETCQVVELMYTLERLSQVFGGGVYGDRLESAAFSVLPASSDPEMLAHQYLQQPNQVSVSVAQRPWTESTDDANIFGLEPHFGCCTANLHQGWPKLVRSAWVEDADGALRVVSYLPCTISTRRGDTDMTLVVDTDYPFEETVTIRVSAAAAVHATLRLRIPSWAADARLCVGGETVEVRAEDGYVEVTREWGETTTIALTLPMRPRVERRENQSAVVLLGPLTLALRIAENWHRVPDAPGLAEWEIHPRGSWNLALADIENAAEWTVERRSPGPIPFRLADAPVEVHTRGAQVRDWGLRGAEAGPLPVSPVRDAGPALPIVLVPYGSARLRITEFPVLPGSDPFEQRDH